jgi:Flp pilus assembly protein TadB
MSPNGARHFHTINIEGHSQLRVFHREKHFYASSFYLQIIILTWRYMFEIVLAGMPWQGPSRRNRPEHARVTRQHAFRRQHSSKKKKQDVALSRVFMVDSAFLNCNAHSLSRKHLADLFCASVCFLWFVARRKLAWWSTVFLFFFFFGVLSRWYIFASGMDSRCLLVARK